MIRRVLVCTVSKGEPSGQPLGSPLHDKPRHLWTGQRDKVQPLHYPPIPPVYAAENSGLRSLAGDTHRQAWFYLVDVLELAFAVKEALYAFGYGCGVCGLRKIGHEPNAVLAVVLGDDTL